MVAARLLDATSNFGKARVLANFDFTAAALSVTLETGDGADLPDPAVKNYNLTVFRLNLDTSGNPDPSGFPDAHDDPNRDIVRVTAKIGDVLTIVRNQEGITASSHNVTNARYLMIAGITNKTMDDIEAKIALIETVAFHVTSASQSMPTGVDTIIDFNSAIFDKTSDFDLVNNKFVAPHALLLWVSWRINPVAGTDGNFVRGTLRINTVNKLRHFDRYSAASSISVASSGILDLASGDDVDFIVDHEESGSLTNQGCDLMGFSIRKD